MSENSHPEFNLQQAADTLRDIVAKLHRHEPIEPDSVEATQLHVLAQTIGRDTAKLAERFNDAWKRVGPLSVEPEGVLARDPCAACSSRRFVRNGDSHEPMPCPACYVVGHDDATWTGAPSALNYYAPADEMGEQVDDDQGDAVFVVLCYEVLSDGICKRTAGHPGEHSPEQVDDDQGDEHRDTAAGEPCDGPGLLGHSELEYYASHPNKERAAAMLARRRKHVAAIEKYRRENQGEG